MPQPSLNAMSVFTNRWNSDVSFRQYVCEQEIYLDRLSCANCSVVSQCPPEHCFHHTNVNGHCRWLLSVSMDTKPKPHKPVPPKETPTPYFPAQDIPIDYPIPRRTV